MKKTVAALTALALGAFATAAMAEPGDHPRRAAMLERLKAADTNADGLISRTEAAALPRIAERFDAIDANKDGQVSFEELRAARGKHRGHGEHFKRVDTDNDGKVSKPEALAAAGAMFDRADANKDGFVTQDEMRSAHKGKRGHGHGK